MALPSDWKIGKFLEWCTELPYINRPRISQTFLFQNTECYFQLNKDGANKYYYMYLKTKNVPAKLTKTSFILYMIYGNAYTRKEVVFHDSNSSILFFSEAYFPNQTMDFSQGFFTRFIFMFENTVGPLLPSKTEKGKINFLSCVLLNIRDIYFVYLFKLLYIFQIRMFLVMKNFRTFYFSNVYVG